MQRKKPFIEERKAVVEKQLAAMVGQMTSAGLSEKEIQHNAAVRHLQGEVRQAKHQLASIAALVEQTARKAEIKAEKLAAPKVSPPKKKHAPNPAKKKAKKDRAAAAATAADTDD